MIEMSGKYGRWEIIKRAKRDKHGIDRWLCRCECGRTYVVNGQNLRRGLSTQCQVCHKQPYGENVTDILSIFHEMKKRCYGKWHKAFDSYGGRGITICQEWLDNPKEFVMWAKKNGYRKDLSIDRIDNDGNYSPENCKFSTAKEQMRNRRTTIKSPDGESFASMVEKFGVVSYNTAWQRVKKYGWNMSRAASTPAREY